ncbi:Metallo-dependent phosphatase-like protein [Pilobolus umbonatus]|nr:Metallo-dependent phosphatase-like protein [Pilobolus umbonatus]
MGRKEAIPNGLPGDISYADPYNTAVGNWNRTWSKEYDIHTPSHKKEFSFLFSGDITLLKQRITINILGDHGYDLNDSNGTKGDDYFNYMQELMASVPCLGGVGNHEEKYNYTHYKNRFNAVPYEESNSDNSLMYSIDYKELYMVSFSTEVFLKGSVEEMMTTLNWLRKDLKKANRNRDKRPWVIGIEDILLEYEVDIYACGHTHHYERTCPVANGLITSTAYHNAPSFFQLVIGDGGQPEPDPSFTGNLTSFSAKRFEGFGFSTFTLSKNTLRSKHYQVNVDGSLGRVIDDFKVTKFRGLGS